VTVPATIPQNYLTPVGLNVDEDSITYEQWVDIGKRIARSGNAVQWAIGDWAVIKDHRFSHIEGIDEVVASLGIDKETLRNYHKVCKRIPKDRRRATLSFSHHKAVAFLDYEDQERLLDMAEEEGLNKIELERAVAEEKTALPPAPGPQGPGASSNDIVRLRQVELRAAEEHYLLWQQAAEEVGVEVEQWAVQVLNEAAEVVAEQQLELIGEEDEE
jgi:hypothetical protein